MNAQKIGNVISELREAKGMTQAQLAQRLNVSDKAISKWETGRGYPDISFIAAVKDDGVEMKKLYAEGNAEAHFKISRTKYILYYCNIHGLFKVE